MIGYPEIRPMVLLLLLLVLLPGCEKPQPEAPPAVLLQVDGRAVTLEAFRRDFAKTLPPGQNLSAEETEDLQRSFLIQLIDRQLTLAEADRLGLTLSPGEVEAVVDEYRQDYPAGAFEQMLAEQGLSLAQWRRALEEGLLMEKVVRQAVYTRVSVSDEEIAVYFEENRDEFDRPAQVRARQIVVGSEDEGERVLGLLRQGEPFAEVAGRYSLSPDGEQGGDLGFFSPGEMPPEFDQTVFSLPVGQLSKLVKSDYGYHIFVVEERREAVRLGLEAVADEIRKKLLAAGQEQAYQQWLQELRAGATIEVNWSLL